MLNTAGGGPCPQLAVGGALTPPLFQILVHRGVWPLTCHLLFHMSNTTTTFAEKRYLNALQAARQCGIMS